MASFFRPFLRQTVRFSVKPFAPASRRYSGQTARSTKSSSLSFAAAAGVCGIAIGFGAAQWPFLQGKNTSGTAKPVYGTAKEFSHAIDDLRQVFSTRSGVVSTDPDDLKVHGMSTNTYHEGIDHSVVIYPESTEDVVKIVKIANKYKMPITPYSGATSLEGQIIGHPGGGICIDMSGMNKILEIHEADADVVCQPGLGWMELNETLQSQGIPLFFPIDPAPEATIGGMASTGCSGSTFLFFSSLPLHPNSHFSILKTFSLSLFNSLGSQPTPSATAPPNPSGSSTSQSCSLAARSSRRAAARGRARRGWDVGKLFVGAEGTLGIITEVTLRLAPLLPTTVASVQFPDVKAAVEASIEILRSGVAGNIQCVELVDDTFMAATNKFGASRYQYAESDALFFKFQGPSPSSLTETARVAQTICIKHGGTGFRLAKDDAEAKDIWQDRKNAHFVGMAMVPGARGWVTDVCVPISKLPQLVLETKEDLERTGLKYNIVGHVGDGNFHTLLLFKTDEELQKVKDASHRMVQRAIALDGTCTGEHGVGIGKREFLIEELGAGTVALMKAIKHTVDPLGLMNPGKLYPDDEESESEQH
ncbi:FAD-binding protein [Mycena sanguinolenta]|uniref:D-lactate dehydrogenase (cytochrome) n=1 Tax=Mycena sanguinolenta TaxID=230812 RepID=A0A8H6ZDV7_9AGAR|nr:FAD-binding protein [Mycena sanguinolenta]